MKATKYHIIFNPFSAGGKTREKLHSLLKTFKQKIDEAYLLTIIFYKHQAEQTTRNSLLNGTDTIIVVGGDGTLQEVVNGFFYDGKLINPLARLAVISSGTGEGLARSLFDTRDIGEQMLNIANGKIKKIDLLKAEFDNGKERYIVNELQIGVGGEVVKNTNGSLKKFGGKIAFAIGTLRSAIKYKGIRIKLNVGEINFLNEYFTGLVAGNGKYTGGGMSLTPNAFVDDGLIDVLLIPQLSALQKLLVFPKIYTGSHLRSKGFKSFKTKNIKIEVEPNTAIEADGELFESQNISLQVIPSVLNICCA